MQDLTDVNVFQVVALLVSLTALFSYLNHRFLKLPTTIGVMIIALVISLVLVGLGNLGLTSITDSARTLLQRIDFDKTLMQGMLSFLLFAGALHIDINDLTAQKRVISILATVGVILSTFIFGSALYLVLALLQLNLDYIYCLLCGAFISPTDPIAVLGILKQARIPKSLKIKISGESLFNDGIGVVVFTILFEIAFRKVAISTGHIVILFLAEAIGGALFGLFLGWLTYRLLKSIDNYQVEVLITLALVMGGYTAALALHTSGPIAIVVAGLFVGNRGRHFAMSAKTRRHLDTFWELTDSILNAVLFVLIGLEVLMLSFSGRLLLAGLGAIPFILLARWISVGVPVAMLTRWQTFTPGAVTIMTWGGLRGGISVALALSLPSGRERDILLAVTYIIVAFSIICQGLTIQPVVQRRL